MKKGIGVNWKEVRIGYTSDNLTVIAKADKPPSWYRVQCACGVIFDAHPANIVRQSSCGCIKARVISERRKRHGDTKSGTYKVWHGLRQRCMNQNDPRYQDYGGRGITVCKRWDVYENFRADMGERPKGMQIDRIDNMGNYEPENCRWVTPKQNQNNKRTNTFVEFNGIRRTISEWADATGINVGALLARKRLGWDWGKALTMPLEARRARNVAG